MESLITASIGLFENDDKFYVQIISADEYNFYFCEVTKEDAELISDKEGVKIERTFDLPFGAILEAPANHPLKLLVNGIKSFFKKGYSMNRQSFQKFLATKRTVTPEAYTKLISAEFFPDLYEGVEAILLYHHRTPIYQLAKGEVWEYNSFSCMTETYGYFRHDEELIESDNLYEVEQEMFKDYIEFYKD